MCDPMGEGGDMKTKRMQTIIVKVTVLFALLALVLPAGTATAKDVNMQTNMIEVADQMARWSKQCGAKPLTPEAQAKLSELLIETSRLLKQIAANSEPDMQMQYNQKIAEMEEAWNPFDTFYGN